MKIENVKNGMVNRCLITLVSVAFSSVMLLSSISAVSAEENPVLSESVNSDVSLLEHVETTQQALPNPVETVEEAVESPEEEVSVSEETFAEEETTVDFSPDSKEMDETTETLIESPTEKLIETTVEMTSEETEQSESSVKEEVKIPTPLIMNPEKTVKNGYVSSEKKYYKDGVVVTNAWTQDTKTGDWYFSNAKGIVEQSATQNGYQINGVPQKDKHLSIYGTSYYYDLKGQLLRDSLAYSESMMAWFKSGTNGVLNYEVTPWGHYVNGVQQFDVLAKVNNLEYYFEPQKWSGTMAVNKWSYSPSKESWYHSNIKGEVEQSVTPQGYTKNGVVQKDKHISIGGIASYYFESNGKMSRNKTSRSESMNSWFKSAPNGVLTYEITPWGHYVNGVQQFDVLAKVNDLEYYFEPQGWNGAMAVNKWAYSPSKKSWYHANIMAIINKKVTPNAYTVDGVIQKDKHISIDGIASYYFELDGKMSRNKTSRSESMNAWFKSAPNGVLTYEVTPWGHYVDNVQQFDIIAKINNKSYYFEPKQWNGTMATGKWSYSPKTKLWYLSDSSGVVTRKDKYGAKLPSRVVLDRGQWTMYMLYQDGWESGCWLRTAASGINSAGGNQSPFTLIKHIKRTDDPRTGMLSHPSVVNNWNLGGAYSAMWPEALVPVVKKFVPNAADMTGASFNDIKRELANGNTVQIYYAWASPNIRLQGSNGTSFLASRDYHSILLTGYDSTGFYHQEHWGNPRNNHFSYSKLQWQFNTYGKKAIVYRKQSILP
ncbi:C39 family peptidase [Globicatella sanguinis]|uniref:C39 family peptidase n=1 Tax=Globicatella sanguinis TaxID=13076 RepID=UPI0025438A33|nr:C39 family peptidase [Globicatella sanguinis]MDK7631107.1 C39 family peptidase [Globicatella sanguinis]WIK66113.1 C39 family peptidase [Globicatella sanguinis]WKT55518.1 C39 family peptidase [Globicatella sanguinis]